MDNCYFCHTPVFTDEVRLTLRRLSHVGIERKLHQYAVEEAAHPECLEAARMWFVYPEPRRIPVSSTGSRDAPDR